MKCPYCQSGVDALATVCAACRRDFHLVRSLQDRVSELESALAAAGRSTGSSAQPETLVPVEHAAYESPFPTWAVWVAAAVALMLAHLLIVIVFDLPTLWLRVSTLFIPIPFAYLAARTSGRGFAWNLGCALVVSLGSVLAMSAAVAVVDGTPIVPDSRVAVVEFLQYAASILFSFSTGLVLGAGHARSILRAAMPFLRWLLHAREITPELLQKRVELLHKILAGLTAIGTTVASVVTGLHHLIGK